MMRLLMAGFVLMQSLALPLCVADELLQARVESTRAVLGEPVRFTVELHRDTPSLAELQLDALRHDFLVQDVSYDTRSQIGSGSGSVQRLVAALYPLHTGELRIPELHLHTWRSDPIGIFVQAPAAGDGPRVISGTDPFTVWERQPTFVWLDIEDAATAAEIEVGLPMGQALHARALPPTDRMEQHSGRAVAVRRYAWAVSALRGGIQHVHFPMVKIRMPRRGGAVVLRYPPAPVAIQARALPVYIPVQTPVGTLKLATTLPDTEIWTGQSYNWRVRISGRGLSLQGIKSLLAPQLVDTAAFRFYPPSYRWLDTAGAHPPGRDESGRGALVQTLEVLIPFVAQQAGSLAMPTLVLPYVDSSTGRMASVELANTVEVSRLWMHRTWRTVQGIVLLTAMFVLWRLVRLHYLRRRLHRQLRSELEQADDVFSIKAALLKYGQSMSHRRILTLGQWQRWFDPDGVHRKTIESLQKACYDPSTDRDSATLKSAVLSLWPDRKQAIKSVH